jgi:ABC-type transporter Mla subunit MlaD
MLTHETSTELLDATMGVLEGNMADGTPQQGTGIIDQWLVQLRQADNAKEISDTLEHLKTLLKSDQMDTEQLSQTLSKLSTQTTEFSTFMGSEGDIAPRLEGLASALRELAGQASHS